MNIILRHFRMTFLLSVMLSQAARAQGVVLPDAIFKNNQAVESIEKDQAREAEKQFLNLLEKYPFQTQFKYNLGLSLFSQKKWDDAYKEFARLAQSLSSVSPKESDELRFMSHFNAALAAQELKKVDEALAQYQQALDIKPDSLEVKTNIELLLQNQGQGEGDPQDSQNQQQNQQGQSDKPQKSPQKPQGQKPDKNLKDILEELQRQEQRIRAMEYGNQKGSVKGPDKDW